MASRKKLKKTVNKVCSDLLLLYALVWHEKQPTDATLDRVGNDILTLKDEFVKRINHTEPGSVRLFYAKLRQEFSEKVREIYGILAAA